MCNPESEYHLESDPFFIKGRDLFNSMKVKCFTNARPLAGIRRGQDYIRDVMKKSGTPISSDELCVRMDHIMLAFPIRGNDRGLHKDNQCRNLRTAIFRVIANL